MQAMLFRIGDGRSVNGLQLQPNPLIHITTLAVLGLFLEGVGIPAPHQLKDGIAFTVLVLILIFRPSGILGERLSKRA